MNIDCKDCGQDWCARHVPVTRKIKCKEGHTLTMLSEGIGWCRLKRLPCWFLWESIPGEVQLHQLGPNFSSYEALNDWFIANIIKEEVTA